MAAVGRTGPPPRRGRDPPARPGSAGTPGDAYLWEDFDSATGSFLYWEYWFGTDAWVISADGDEVGEMRCPTPFCRRSAFGPAPDEVTVPPPDERCSGDTCVVGLALPVRLQILGWDGTERDSMDISAAFDPDGAGTTERSLIALSWTPDGSRLAVGTEGGSLRPVCHLPGATGRQVPAPDGR